MADNWWDKDDEEEEEGGLSLLKKLRRNAHSSTGVSDYIETKTEPIRRQKAEEEQQRKEYEQWVETNQYGPYGDERDRAGTGPNALTPEMEYRRQAASGGGNRLTPYQVAMQAATAATPPTPETRSTDELRRDMNRQNRIARGTERMTADMAGQGLRDQSLLFNPTYTTNLRTMGQTMEAQQNKAAAATNLYQTLSVQRREQEEREKYAALLQNPDFAAKSQGDPTIGNKVSATALSPAERLYQSIFNHGGEKTNAKDRNAAEFVSDEEAGIFFYLWNTQGPKAATAYYNGYVDNRASDRKAAEVQGQAQAFGASDRFVDRAAASIASVGYNVASGVGLIDIAYQNLVRAIGLEDRNKPINYNSGAMMPALVTDSLREGVADYLEKRYPNAKIGNSVNVASFLYETGMSMADSGVAILLNTVGVPEAATLAMMGAAAGTRAIRDARERGASDGQALAFGISSAIMEALFEKISLDSILKESNAHNLAQSILGTLKQGFTESSEEVMTTLANTAADMFIMGDKAEVFAMQRRLMEQGVSEKEALKAALTQWGTGILGDAMGGFISGAGMGGVKEYSNARNNPLYQWNMPMDEARALQNIEQNGLPQERGITPELQRNIDEGIRAQNEREIAQDRETLEQLRNAPPRLRIAEDRRNAAAASPLPQQARQITPESVTTPPVPGNAQRGAETAEKTGESLISPSGTASPRGSQEAGAESQTLGNPPVPGARVAEIGGNNSEENRLRIPENPQNVRNSGDNSQEARLRVAAAESRNDTEILWTAPKNNGGWKEKYNGPSPMVDALRAANPALLDAYMQEAAEGNADTPIIDAVAAVYEDVRQGTISPMAGAEIINQVWQMGQTDEMKRDYLKSIYSRSTGNLTSAALNAAKDIDRKHRGGLRVGQAENPAAAVGQQANAGQTETAPAAEAAEAGNDLADGGRGGLSGQRAGEQDGRVAKLSEARSAVSQFDTASRRRSDAKNLPSERVNARDHIPEAAEGSTLTFAPEQMVQQDKELRTVKRRLESITGRKVYYTLGGIKRTGADGKTGTARAAITPDGIYLRCDDDSASVTQLGGHELYHYYEEQFPGLHDRVRQKITERYSEEKFREIAGRYAEKLGRLNGMAEDMDAESYEAMVRRIESEIFADAFGNINYFRLGADRYTDAARETVNETLGSETAAATERRTGPPETRFSTQGEVLARNDVDWMENDSSIKSQLREHAKEINYLQPVATVDYVHNPKESIIEIITKAVSRIGGGRMKNSGVEFVFDKEGIESINTHATGAELRAAALAAPYVAKYGKLIAGQKNHENTGLTTLTFAAPVEINGTIANVGVVVQFQQNGRPRAVNVGLQDGGKFKIKEASRGTSSRVDRYSQGTSLDTRDASEARIAEEKPDVKTSFSMTEDEEIPDNAAEYSRQRYREEHREPQSAAEYAQMKEQARAREKELKRLIKKGEATAEQRKEAEELRKKNAPPPAKTNKQQATIAKKDLRNTIISEFGIPDGRKAEIGRLIDAYADRVYKDGKLTETDRQALFDKLYSEGVMTVPADDAFRAAREIIKGGRVYVPESVKHEFGDDWGSFRREAFAEGILLTNNKDDMGWDSWNVELSGELPGLFAEDETDPREFLERVVHLAREGRDQEMSLAEYAATVIGTEYVSEDDLLDNMERKLDWALRSYADKAGLEIWMKNKTEEKLARQREKFGERLDREKAQRLAKEQKEREKRKEAARKQTMNRELREMQQKTLKQLQWLSRNKNKIPKGEMRDRAFELLEDMDVLAVGAADEMHIDRATGMTWRDLVDIYRQGHDNDPNWLPNKKLEDMIMRLDAKKIADLDMDELQNLYRAVAGLRQDIYNRNNLINSELHETYQEVFDQVKGELRAAKGNSTKGIKRLAEKIFNDHHMTPMNVFEYQAGWNPDSAWYKMGKMLEEGEREERHYITKSQRIMADFLKEHKEWAKRSDGQGKDGIWYEVEAPEILEHGKGDKPILGNTVKVYMTAAQKVELYLETKGYENLRHMTGGRTFANRELYSRGQRNEAYAKGTTIALTPEQAKNLVKDLTPEEKALADTLEKYYNEFSKEQINKASNALDGYDRAMGDYYAPIYTNPYMNKSEPGKFDVTAEGVGNLKERVVSFTPTLNISAYDAFERSVKNTAKYVGLAIPVHNVNTLMNWKSDGQQMKAVLAETWGDDAVKFVDSLLTELQSGRESDQSSIEKLTNAALSRYISAVFGANPSIVTKQFASYPLAAAYLGWDNMPLNIPRAAKVDTDLIAKYTGEYDYRQLGYAMPETATLKDNPGKLQERGPLNFIFGGGAITWMDGFTVRTLWTWAENKVNKEQPGLERGSKEQIDAGNSEYYKAVAAEFEEALSRSQPMYDTMHRANIMREPNPITRAFTLFKTVPMQEYNMLRQAIGEAQYAKEAKLDKETQAAARQKAGRAFAGILTGNLMIGAITILNALWKNRGKKYRDEDGELSAEKLIAEAGKQYFKDAAGLVIGGGEAADILSSILFGDKWYGLETPGMEQIESILEQTVQAGNTVKDLVRDSIEVLANGGNWAQYMADHSDKYLSAVDSVARTLGTYATGLPIDNVKAYLLGAVQWLSPAVNTAYEDALKKADRSGLKGLSGASLEIRTKHILQERAGSAEDSTVEALTGLYEAGYKDAIPAEQVTKITVDGEERQLNLAQQQTYKRAWQTTVGGSIDELVGSKDFQNADEATQAKMLKKLYDLANKKAASALFDDYEDSAIGKADAYTEAGASLADYAAMSGAVSGQKRAESYETILGSDMSDEAKLAAIGNIIGTDMVTETGNPTQWARLNTAVKDGLSVDRAMELMQSNLLDDYVKFSDAGVDSKNADNIVTAISKLKPEEGYEEVRGVQKWNAIIGTVSGSANQEKALKASMTESQWKAYKDSGVGAELYVKFKYDTRNYTSTRDAEGKEVKGQAKKDKMIAYIDGLNASAAQKDALYLTEYKESGLKDTPWHSGGGKGSGSYAMARTPALRIPEAPKAEKIQSGRKISTGEPTQRQSSGLRIRGTQPGETRQGSGLRIRDAAPAAQAPRSGLRIRAK